jgi:multidrug efflux pump
MAERQQALGRAILKDPAVASLSSFIGVDGTNATLNSGRIQINLKPLDERKTRAGDIIRRLQPALAQVSGITLYMQPVQELTVEDRVSRTQFQYSLEDPDSAELAEWSPKLVAALQKRPELADVATDQQNRGLRTTLVFDRSTMSRLGITPQAVDDALYDAFGQRQVSTMFTQLNQYRVVLEVDPGFSDHPEDLRNIYVHGITSGSGTAPATGTTGAPTASSAPPGTSVVPLSAFTTLQESRGTLAINHQGQFPVVTISFNLAPGASLGQAVKAIEQARAEVDLPASIQADFQGSARAFRASLVNTPLLILAAIITVYILLGVLYESYIHPVTILSTLPSAGVGALLSLMICGMDFNVIALIGIILLIGIVEKNAIMMIDFALDAERKEGKPPHEAIFQAALLRLRPILMTTFAALLAGVPLALGGGTGSELRKPLGVAIVGGLIFSQVLTLYTTPVIYLAFDRLARRVAGRKAARRPAAAPGATNRGGTATA